jgi:adenylate cyclase
MASQLKKAMILGLLIAGLGSCASFIPNVHGLEESLGLHLLFHLRGPVDPPSEVAIVALDQSSAQQLGLPDQPEAWPRHLHGRLVSRLHQQGTAVIAFDLHFHRPRTVEEDTRFARSLKQAGNVVLCAYLDQQSMQVQAGSTGPGGSPQTVANIETIVPPIDRLAAQSADIAPFPLPKTPVRLSRYWPFRPTAGDCPSLPVVAFKRYLLARYPDVSRCIEEGLPRVDVPVARAASQETSGLERLVSIKQRLRAELQSNPSRLPKLIAAVEQRFGSGSPAAIMSASLLKAYAGSETRWLDFYGPPGSIRTVSFIDVLQDETAADADPFGFRNAAVFVGVSEDLRPEHQDTFYTVFSQPNGKDLSGVEIAATAFANLLEDKTVQPVPPLLHLLIVTVWGLGIGLAGRFLKPLSCAVLCLILGAGYLALTTAHFSQTGLWYPIIIPLGLQLPVGYVASLAWRHLDTAKEKDSIRRAFQYHLPKTVVDELVEDLGSIGSGRIVQGTCLCTDARRYTSLSESMHPLELSRLLNDYYQTLFTPVRDLGGVVSDIKGDSMMAFWASTSGTELQQRQQACLAALQIDAASKTLSQTHPSLHLETNIAVHSGQMAIGTVGAVDHYEYRAVGDIVNTVSRLETVNKHLGTSILVSGSVVDGLNGFCLRNVGVFLLEGKSQPLSVSELLCRQDEATHAQKEICRLFSMALEAYRNRQWAQAMSLFGRVLSLRPGDGPSLFYARLCNELSTSPPDGAWDGSIALRAGQEVSPAVAEPVSSC